jgi:hypothetical protein
MIRIITFTKNRKMQLQAYLESLYFYTNASDIFEHIIIMPNEDSVSNEICEKFPHAIGYYEEEFGSFDKTLRYVVNEKQWYDDDVILFSVDDFIWFKPFNLDILNTLKDHDDTLGFTLRLGTNVTPYQNEWNESKDKRFIKFDWRRKPSHYGYPFEVSQSAYRAGLFKEIVTHSDEPFRIPNDLEGRGVLYCISNMPDKHPKTIMMNTTSYGACADVNRTQNLYENRVQGGVGDDVEHLSDLYAKGQRLDWTQYADMIPEDCFIGKERWSMINEEKI